MAPEALRTAALRYRAAGLSVLPACAERKCPTVPRWGPYQKQLPTIQEVVDWFARQPDGLCLICGAVSGNLELIDFDLAGEAFEAWHRGHRTIRSQPAGPPGHRAIALRRLACRLPLPNADLRKPEACPAATSRRTVPTRSPWPARPTARDEMPMAAGTSN